MPLQSIEFLPEQPIKYPLPVHGISARFFCKMYSAFGIESTERLKQFTYGVCDVSRIVDDAIDMQDVETPPTLDILIERLERKEIPVEVEADSVIALRYIGSLNEEQLNFARNLYLDAVEVADYRTSAKNISEYSEAIKREGVVQCRALAVSEDSAYKDLESRKKYNDWLEKFVLAGYFIDSALDLPEDHSEGRTQVPSSIAYKLALIKRSIPPAREAVSGAPLKVMPLLGSLAIGFHVTKINKRFSVSELADI